MSFFAAACALGVAAGAAFAWLWLRVVPRGTNRRFWSTAFGLGGELLKVDEVERLLRLYRRLGALLAAYLGRNILGTVLAGLPAIAILLAAAPFAPDTRVEVAFFVAFGLAATAGLLWPQRS